MLGKVVDRFINMDMGDIKKCKDLFGKYISIRVELFRNNSMAVPEKKDGEDLEKVRRKGGEDSEKNQIYELTDTQKKMMELLRIDKQLSAKKIAEQLGLGSRSIEKILKS